MENKEVKKIVSFLLHQSLQQVAFVCKCLGLKSSVCSRVSNGTGQWNFLGQRDRSSFIVQGQRDNRTSSKSCHKTGQAGLGQPVKIRDGQWDGTINIFLSKSGTGQSLILSLFFWKWHKGAKLKAFCFFGESDFVPGCLETEEVVLGFLLLPLSPGQRDSRTRKYFCPETSRGRSFPWKP
jgi:hypothetical protein